MARELRVLASIADERRLQSSKLPNPRCASTAQVRAIGSWAPLNPPAPDRSSRATGHIDAAQRAYPYPRCRRRQAKSIASYELATELRSSLVEDTGTRNGVESVPGLELAPRTVIGQFSILRPLGRIYELNPQERPDGRASLLAVIAPADVTLVPGHDDL
jgi:hypothetical protein